MNQQFLDEPPAITRPFYRQTRGTVFNADTLRSSPLGKYIEPIHGYGGIFGSWKKMGLTEYVGETRSVVPSNKGRKIDCFKWSKLADERFGEKETI